MNANEQPTPLSGYLSRIPDSIRIVDNETNRIVELTSEVLDELIRRNNHHKALVIETQRLQDEIVVLRSYGNKDCTAMADAALERIRKAKQ